MVIFSFRKLCQGVGSEFGLHLLFTGHKGKCGFGISGHVFTESDGRGNVGIRRVVVVGIAIVVDIAPIRGIP